MKIQKYDTYQDLLQSIQCEMKLRINRTYSDIFRILKSIELDSETAVAIRGSYSRGSPTAFSDIDIAVIAKGDQGFENCIFKKLSTNLQSIECSTIRYSTHFSYSQRENICSWQDLYNVKFVYGNKSIFNAYLEKGSLLFPMENGRQLVGLYKEDRKERTLDHQTALDKNNLKCGNAGTVEIEIAQLLTRWLSLNGHISTSALKNTFDTLNYFYWYNIVCKEVYQTLSQKPLEIRTYDLSDSRSKLFPDQIFSENRVENITAKCEKLISKIVSYTEVVGGQNCIAQ